MSTQLYRKCCKCGATAAQDKSVAFYRFPKPSKDNTLKAKVWAIFCWPEKEWNNVDSLLLLHNQSKVLCGRHFDESYFLDSSKKKISKFAVPGTMQYVKDLLHTLREQAAIGQQGDLIQIAPVARQRDTPTPGFTKEEVSSSLIAPLPETSKQHDAPTPECTKDKPSRWLITPVAGTSKQQDAPTPECTIDKEITSAKRTTTRRSILKSLNVEKLSQLTETERKMYDVCKKTLKEINRLRKNLKQKKKINKTEKYSDNEHVKKLLKMNISNSFVLLLQSQIKNCPKKPKGRRYSLDEKILALGIYKKSPATYRLLRPQIFIGLKNMAEKQTDEENLCVLLFDEMAIKKFLTYNMRLDLVEGFQDHGREHGRSNQVACNALVFMVCGIRKQWKQPVAFYLSGKSLTSDRMHILIKETLTECFKAGINVLGTVCDMSSVNFKALKKLGATPEQPYILHAGKEIVTIADPPHLLKCTRNMFLAHNIECNIEMQSDGKVVKGTAKWKHVKDFYELEKCNPHFVFAPALSEKHINPNAKQKMRVKLAAQVFSHSVAAGIYAKVATVETLATTTLLKKIDELFDTLNANTPDARRGKKYSTNMSPHSPHLKLFDDMKRFIKSLKFEGCLRDPPSKSGWIMTMNAVERLWRNLNNLGVQSLSTRRLNQDPVENFFGCVRYNSGSNCNPTVAQFIAGVKTAIISNLRNTSSRKNCEDDTAVLADNLKAFLTAPAIEKSPDNYVEQFDVVLDTVETEIDMASPEAQACAYVCGFIVKKIRNERCQTCKKALLAADTNESTHIFTSFKEYSEKQSLKYVTIDMVQAVESCATILRNVFELDLWKENIKTVALSALKNVNFRFLHECQTHASENSDFILRSVFFIVIKRFIVLKNRGFSEDDQKKQLERKLKIFKSQ